MVGGVNLGGGVNDGGGAELWDFGTPPQIPPPTFGLRMPWQGDTNNMIDRFDVRAHLDHIPTYSAPLLSPV